jgi:SAM-dependent methyltransferase
MIFRFLSAVLKRDQVKLAELDKRLRDFYRDAQEQDYWSLAGKQNADWHDGAHPHHLRLGELIGANESVVDFGCGSAHPIAALGNADRYVGLDWSESQVRENQRNYPAARFLHTSLYETQLPDDQFAWAISLFTLEHCVFPTRLLDEMQRVVQPGGQIAILCPQMRPHVMNSMWSGLSAIQSFWAKLKSRRYIDALWHVIELRCLFPLFCRVMDRWGGAFLIYPQPRCFFAPYSFDTDAVYWADESEVRDYLIRKGFDLESEPTTSGSGMVFVIARKPPSTKSLEKPFEVDEQAHSEGNLPA